MGQTVDSGFFYFMHKDKYLMLNVHTSMSFEVDQQALAYFVDKKGTVTNEALNEINQLTNRGVFTEEGLSNYYKNISKISLAVNPQCNLSCGYCFRDKGKTQEKKMELADVYKTIDYFLLKYKHDVTASVATYPVNSPSFSYGSYGETLVDLDYFQAIKEHIITSSKELGVNSSCNFWVTNATLLTPTVIKELMESRKGLGLVISIDGPAKLHDRMRRYPNGKGSYGRVVENLEDYNKRYHLTANATLTGDKPFVTKIFMHLYELGFKEITIKPVRAPHSADFSLNRFTLKKVKEEYSKFTQFLISQTDDDLLSFLSVLSNTDFIGRFFERLFLNSRHDHRCEAYSSAVCVDARGDIYPCSNFVGLPPKLGRVSDDFVDAPLEARRKKLSDQLFVDDRPVCADCWARYLCGGGCYFSSWLCTGDLTKPDPVKCELIKHNIKQSMILLQEISNRPQVFAALNTRYRHRSLPAASCKVLCRYTESSPVKHDGLWEKADEILLNRKDYLRGPKIWRGPEDLSAELRVLWDEKFFYLLAMVMDDLFLPPESIYLFGDGLEFAFEFSGHHRVWRYTISLISSQPVAVLHDYGAEIVKGIVSDIRREGKMIRYLVACPWRIMEHQPQVGDTCKFNIAVKDRDALGNPSQAWMEWTPGLIVENNPDLFGEMLFT